MAHDASKPSKEALRNYLAARHQSKSPPPTPDEIRRQLGWDLLPVNLKKAR
jgi:hypothetical protein